MFDMAAAEAEAGRIDELETPLDWVAGLRTRLLWARLLEENIFLELFLRLYSARREWHANPREPFNVSRVLPSYPIPSNQFQIQSNSSLNFA